ncbi:hypothetical protein HAX54_029913 [Datura stramonium]|uniref:Uncharacterized protein n=1 Tax=Datura stramonium TaxID=4076 RepID=A0ABS8Y6A9_DATST|nr:hypothetical protein [Datura stramonium]
MLVYYSECLMVGHNCGIKAKKAPVKKHVVEKVWQRKDTQPNKPEEAVNIQSQEEFPILQKGHEMWKEAKGKSTVRSRIIEQTSGDVATMNGFSMLSDVNQHIVVGPEEGVDYGGAGEELLNQSKLLSL